MNMSTTAGHRALSRRALVRSRQKFVFERTIHPQALHPHTRQIELDVSDAERHAYTLSELDENGVWIDMIQVYGSYSAARRGAERVSHRTGLPIVVRTVHPALG
jgi:hypothetical protein